MSYLITDQDQYLVRTIGSCVEGWKQPGMMLCRWLSVNCMSTLYPADEPWWG